MEPGFTTVNSFHTPPANEPFVTGKVQQFEKCQQTLSACIVWAKSFACNKDKDTETHDDKIVYSRSKNGSAAGPEFESRFHTSFQPISLMPTTCLLPSCAPEFPYTVQPWASLGPPALTRTVLVSEPPHSVTCHLDQMFS